MAILFAGLELLEADCVNQTTHLEDTRGLWLYLSVFVGFKFDKMVVIGGRSLVS